MRNLRSTNHLSQLIPPTKETNQLIPPTTLLEIDTLLTGTLCPQNTETTSDLATFKQYCQRIPINLTYHNKSKNKTYCFTHLYKLIFFITLIHYV